MKDEVEVRSSFILPPSSFFPSAHSRTFLQLLLVQTAPPCSPTKALIAALLFM